MSESQQVGVSMNLSDIFKSITNIRVKVFPFRRIFGRCCRTIVILLLEFLSEREDIVPHGGLKDTVVRNRGAHLLVEMRHTLLSYLRRIKM